MQEIWDLGLIPGLGKSPGGGHGNPRQYSCLEKLMNRGAWWAIVHGVTQNWTQLKWLSMHAEHGRKRKRKRLNPRHRNSSLVPFPLTCSINPSCIQANTCLPGPLAFQENGSHGPVLRGLVFISCVYFYSANYNFRVPSFKIHEHFECCGHLWKMQQATNKQAWILHELACGGKWKFHMLEGTSCLQNTCI